MNISLKDGVYHVETDAGATAEVCRFTGQDLLAICSCGGMVDRRLPSDECEHIRAVEAFVDGNVGRKSLSPTPPRRQVPVFAGYDMPDKSHYGYGPAAYFPEPVWDERDPFAEVA